MNRCPRCLRDQLYIDYHDTERGIPVHDDHKHFEFLLLETFQAGLSRYTILTKRENFRRAFDGFDPQKIAQYTTTKIDELVMDKGIIRNRAKIQGTIANAGIFLDIQKKRGSWDRFIRRYTNGKVINNKRVNILECPTKTELSDRISTDLKKLGMKFVGSTVIYAHLQATGQINDHIIDCWRHNEK